MPDGRTEIVTALERVYMDFELIATLLRCVCIQTHRFDHLIGQVKRKKGFMRFLTLMLEYDVRLSPDVSAGFKTKAEEQSQIGACLHFAFYCAHEFALKQTITTLFRLQ